MRHSNWNILEALPDEKSKAAFMAGGRVTTDTIWQLESEQSKKIVRFYIAKVRGIAVSDNDKYKFNTPEEARAFGNSVLAHWKTVSQQETK